MPTLMNLPTAVLTAIATLRIQGTAWETIAQSLTLTVTDLRMGLRLQREEFQRAMAFATEELLDDVFIESVAKLRQTLNSGNANEEASAAKALLRTCETHQRLALQASKNRSTPPASKSVPCVSEPSTEPPTITAAPAASSGVAVPPRTTAKQPVSNQSIARTLTPKTLHKRTLMKSLRGFFSSV